MPGPYADQKHQFHDEYGKRQMTVITIYLPTGEYGAYRDDEDDGHIRGFGISRLEAIADLKEWIEDNEAGE